MRPDMDVNINPNWRRVTHDVFTDYLKVCADYRQEGFANGNYFYFLHSGNRFAFVATRDEQIYVDPELLTNPEA